MADMPRILEAVNFILAFRRLDLDGIRADTLIRKEQMLARGWQGYGASDLHILDALGEARQLVEGAIRESSDEACGVSSATQSQGAKTGGELRRTSRIVSLNKSSAAPSEHGREETT